MNVMCYSWNNKSENARICVCCVRYVKERERECKKGKGKEETTARMKVYITNCLYCYLMQ